ncbi:dTDP-4-dehydrorhamnose reductase [Aerococcus urinaeequi]|uniref:dTDP-4-dehydrorhamnose reductase n=1 Tax=Aerococcus urinaeequi TaxID=51665 RepID=UPI003D6C2020
MILVTGGKGQLGTEVCYLLDENKVMYKSPDSDELNITDREAVNRIVTNLKPSYIIHCAAYTAVDAAEEEGKYLNNQVNVEGTRNIAYAAKKVGATLIYISTDYVFNGKQEGIQYKVSDQTNPINEYGKAKLLGEQNIKDILDNFYIIRTSWVFGKYGHNFVYTMKNLAKKNKILTVVNDQIGRPTWTRTLAEFIYFVMDKNPEYGVYHLSNDDSCSWFEFAKEILKDNDDIEIVPVTSNEFPQKAKRPQYSIMDLSKAKELGFEIPGWKDALHKMLL